MFTGHSHWLPFSGQMHNSLGWPGGPYAEIPTQHWLWRPLAPLVHQPPALPRQQLQWARRPHPVAPRPAPLARPQAQPLSPADLSLTLSLHPGLRGCSRGPSLPPDWLAVPPGTPPWPGVQEAPVQLGGGPRYRVSAVRACAPCFLLCHVPRTDHSPAFSRSPTGTHWLTRWGTLPRPRPLSSSLSICLLSRVLGSLMG